MKTKRTRLLSLVLSLSMVLALALSGCGNGGGAPATGSPATGTPAGGKELPSGAPQGEAVAGISQDATLTVALSAEPDYLLPSYSESKVNSAINMCIYEPLVDWSVDEGKSHPLLAKSWEWVEDENGELTRIRFTLRDDIKTANGTPITAEDVLFSFQIAASYNNTSLVAFLTVDDFVVEDDYNILFQCNRPYPTLMDRIGNHMYAIVSKQEVEAAGGVEAVLRNPVNIGTGKYVFDSWVDGQSITLVRNDNYWNQEELPYYKYIKFTFVNDTAARAMAVESGDVDIAAEIQASQVPALEGNPDLNVMIENISTNRTFFMNTSKTPLNDERVRQAIFLLLDAQAVRTVANGGYGELSETNFSRLNPYYAAPGADYVREVNVEKARQLLADAGYADGFDLEFMTVQTSQPAAEVVKECLRQGGININISLLEVGTYLNNLFSGTYDTYIGSADNWDGANMLRAVDGRVPTVMCMGGAQYQDEALEALCDAAYSNFDDAARHEAYAAVQQYMRDHYVVIGLCNEVRIECLRAGLTGLDLDMRGYAMYADVRPTA